MIDFLKVYWKPILSALCMLISLIIFLLKKPPKTNWIDYVKTSVDSLLPQLINSVEVPGDGAVKKLEVIKAALNFIKSLYKRSLSDDEVSFWTEYVSIMIERCLSCPQKKEVS